MTEKNEERLQQALKRAILPVTNPELQRDLWPRMLGRLERPAERVPWLDWGVAALLAAILFLFPHAIPMLLYCL